MIVEGLILLFRLIVMSIENDLTHPVSSTVNAHPNVNQLVAATNRKKLPKRTKITSLFYAKEIQQKLSAVRLINVISTNNKK